MMKRPGFVSMIFLLFAAFDVTAQSFSEQEVEQMKDDAKVIESCISRIDQTEYKGLQRRINAAQGEVKMLCQSGQRDKAMTVAIEFAREIASDKNLQAMRECSQMIGRPLPPLPYQEQDLKDKAEHICADM
jgi:protein tyrosine phosphatase (PTP) superfamily phosphohydrolase (DUF442 family)